MSKGVGQAFKGYFNRESYLNIRLLPKDWCTFKGKCRLYQLPFKEVEEFCNHCKYKKKLDVPALLEELNNKKNGG